MSEEQKQVTAIRIADPYVVKLVADEMRRTGEATAAKTAARLIMERLASKETAAASAT